MRYVEGLNEARTLLADFFSILLALLFVLLQLTHPPGLELFIRQ